MKIISERLGGSALTGDAVAGSLRQWYGDVPRDPGAWSARCREVRTSGGAGWLDPLLPAFGDSLAATEAGRRLTRSATSPHGVVVTTGQQPGLFGGPVYTWSKAVSALALADRLERECGVPVTPVFWAATDDADFAEASVTAVALPGGAERVSVSPGTSDPLPMARMPFGDDIVGAFDALQRASGSAASAEVLELARRAYAPGATVGGAYLALLRALLEPLGVPVLDASHPSVRRAARPLLVRALERARAVEQASVDRSRALTESGYEPQVPDARGLSLVFVEGEKGRTRVALDDASAVARAAAVTLGPNVLLRPVVERSLLPTVAYMGGPGEIAYFAQVSAVAEALDADAPLVVPRWSCTLLEPHVERILERLGLGVGDLADAHAAETHLARDMLPSSVASALEAMRARIREGVSGLAASADGAHPTLLPAAVVQGLERTLLGRIERVERRAVAAQKRIAQSTMRDVATARGSLFPFGTRQERALNLLPTMARHGGGLLGEMRDAAAAHAAALVQGSAAAAAAGARA